VSGNDPKILDNRRKAQGPMLGADMLTHFIELPGAAR
jgi:hypothetical protein